MIRVYVEFTASHDGFCVLEDTTVGKVVQASDCSMQPRFNTIQSAKEWAISQGYIVTEYINGIPI